MTNLKLIPLICVFFVGGCTCGEPLHVLPEEQGEPGPLPVGFDDDVVEPDEPTLLEGDGVALEPRAPIVVSTCGSNEVTIAPQAPTTAFGEFQSTPGTGFQSPIDVAFTCPVTTVSVTIFDPDFPGNVMVAFDDTTEVGRVPFFGDNLPGALTTDTETVASSRITRIQLVPDPSDYVAYGELAYN